MARARVLHTHPAGALATPRSCRRYSGDPDEIRAAVSNLIDNAVKYSGRRSQRTVETLPVDGKLRQRARERSGPRHSQDGAEAVFQRFHRVPGPLASRVKGTGLGLYIVRSVAKRHGGRAWAESEGPGRGSTFVLQFPIAK